MSTNKRMSTTECQLTRECLQQNVIRDKASLGARFGVAAVLNLIFALIFFRIGDAKDDDYDMFSHFGAVMFAAISAMFGRVPISFNL